MLTGPSRWQGAPNVNVGHRDGGIHICCFEDRVSGLEGEGAEGTLGGRVEVDGLDKLGNGVCFVSLCSLRAFPSMVGLME